MGIDAEDDLELEQARRGEQKTIRRASEISWPE